MLSRYTRLGASSRVRMFQFVPGLTAMGFDIDSAPLLGDQYLTRLYSGRRRRLTPIASELARRMWKIVRGGYDLVWVEKEAFPWLPAALERALQASSTPYVVDYDDATFHDYDRHPRLIVRRLLGTKIAKVMQGAAAVTVGNQYIADYAIRLKARRVVKLPSVVDVSRYGIREAVDDGKITLGWIGTPKTQQFLSQIGDAIRAASMNVNLEVVAIGASEIEIPGVSVAVRKWTEATETRELRAVDVGIMPLSDTEFSRGKCGYKLIQYMAAGLPTIAYPSDANSSIVEDNVTGILARSPAEWANAIVRLAGDLNLRRRMGAAGRQRAEKRFSLQAVLPRLGEVLSEAAKR